MRKKYGPGLVVLALALLGLAVPALAASSTKSASTNDKPGQMPHVFIIMMENTGLGQFLHSHNAGYMHRLASTYGFADDYFGVTHSSLPNYLAATSGSTWGSNNDDTAQRHLLNHTNIVDQFEAAGISWKAYMQGLPYPGFKGNAADFTAKPHSADNALYLLKHDPFMMYPDVANNPARAKNVVPLDQLATDLKSGDVAQFSWITPNICNDMHGMSGPACPYPSSGVGPNAQQFRMADSFLKYWISRIMASSAWTGDSTIFVTWDEGSYSNVSPYGPQSDAGCCDSPILPNPPVDPATVSGGDLVGGKLFGGGRVPMIVIAREGARHFTNSTPYNHYSLLATVEKNFGLPLLENAGDTVRVQPLTPFLVRH
jgi:phospholipase C